jgi:hypothetical protein
MTVIISLRLQTVACFIVMLSVKMPSVVMLDVIMLNVSVSSVVMLDVIMLNVSVSSVVMLNVVVLIVAAPKRGTALMKKNDSNFRFEMALTKKLNLLFKSVVFSTLLTIIAKVRVP